MNNVKNECDTLKNSKQVSEELGNAMALLVKDYETSIEEPNNFLKSSRELSKSIALLSKENRMITKLLSSYKKGDNWLLNSSKENTLIFVNDDVRVEVRKADKIKYAVHEKNCISFCENDNELVEYLNDLGILEKKGEL